MTQSSRASQLKIFWVVLMLAILALNISSFRPRYEQLLTPAAGSNTALTGQLSVSDIQTLTEIGLTPAFYAGYFTALEFAGAMVFWCLGGVLIWRRPHERMALLFALALLFFIPASTPYLTGLGEQSAIGQLLRQIIQPLGATLLLWVMFVFPNGRFVPPSTRWLFAIWLLYVVTALLFPPLRFQASLIWETPQQALILIWVLSWLCLAGGVQVYRYRNVASAVERQQTKWVVYGLSVVITLSLIATIPLILFPPLNFSAKAILAARLIAFSVVLITTLIWAVTIAIAILRFRLFDIDLIIRRTVQYAAVSAVLVAIYYGSVVLLQTIFTSALGEQSPLIVVVSTLVTAALFNPLRTRLQTFIDRRFYRRKYDAEQILANFAQTVRNEVEMEKLTTELALVVQETMQPTSMSLWLKEDRS